MLSKLKSIFVGPILWSVIALSIAVAIPLTVESRIRNYTRVIVRAYGPWVALVTILLLVIYGLYRKFGGKDYLIFLGGGALFVDTICLRTLSLAEKLSALTFLAPVAIALISFVVIIVGFCLHSQTPDKESN